MNNKTWIIFKNELLATLRRRGFYITTLAIPLLALLGILGYQLVSGLSNPSQEPETTRVGYVDLSGILGAPSEPQGRVELTPFASAEEAKASLLSEDIKEYYVIPADYVATGQIQRYSLRTELEPPANVISALHNFLITNLAQDKLEPVVVQRLQSPIGLTSTTLDRQGKVAKGQGGFGAWIISYLFSILLMVSIFTASGYLLQGLSEEKENRVMEVLLSSVSTRQLITGKVLGLGAAGLVQMAVWLLSAWGLLNIASSSIGGIFGTINFPFSVVVLGVIYYILGYFLFAILMAGAGALTPTARDAQQLTVVFSLLASVPFFMMPFIIQNGDHIINKVLTLFPLTAPLTVMMRLNAGIPVWELVVSVILLLGAITLMLYLAAKIFRIYLLMYGKTPGWKEVWRSVREA